MKTSPICTSIVLVLAASVCMADEPLQRHVVSIAIVPGGGDWYLVCSPDGSVRAHFRPDADISASIGPGVIDFDALVVALRRLRTDEKVESGTHAGLSEEGMEHVKGFYLRDDTLVRYLVSSFRQKWQLRDERFAQHLREHPFFPNDE